MDQLSYSYDGQCHCTSTGNRTQIWSLGNFRSIRWPMEADILTNYVLLRQILWGLLYALGYGLHLILPNLLLNVLRLSQVTDVTIPWVQVPLVLLDLTHNYTTSLPYILTLLEPHIPFQVWSFLHIGDFQFRNPWGVSHMPIAKLLTYALFSCRVMTSTQTSSRNSLADGCFQAYS